MLKLLSKAKKISFPLFSQPFPHIYLILNADLPVIVQSKISAKPVGFLMHLDISNSVVSIPAGSTHLLPVASQLLPY